MGYSFDEQLPPIDCPYQLDISIETYLQIAADILLDRIIELNLLKLSTLMAAAFTEQFPAYARFVYLRTIPVEKLLKLLRMMVRDLA